MILVASFSLGVLLAPGASAASPAFDGSATLVLPAGGASTTVLLKKRLPLTGSLLRASPTMVTGIASDEMMLVVLRALDSAPGQPPAQIVLGKLPDVVGSHVVRIPSGVNRDSGKEVWFEEKWLAPGRYELYTVTSRPGSLRVTMGSSPTRTTLRLSTKRQSTALQTPPTSGPGGPAPSSAQGHTPAVTGESLAMRVLAVDLSAELGEYSVGSCRYSGGPPAGRWLPGCPGGLATLLSTGFVYLDGRQHLSVGAVPALPAGTWGVGSYYQFLGSARSAHHYQAFLTY
jgi:hypothetical protein